MWLSFRFRFRSVLGINVRQSSLFRCIEHIYSFGRASHASGMGEKNAEVISIMVLHGGVTEPARMSVCLCLCL